MKILKLLLGVSMLLFIAIACQREEVPIEKQETESDFITEVLFKGKGESGLDSHKPSGVSQGRQRKDRFAIVRLCFCDDGMVCNKLLRVVANDRG